MSDEACVVLVTVGNRVEAEELAGRLVEERLAACVNMAREVESVYRWRGKICREEEVLLIMKTRRDRFEALRARVAEMHGYEVPEIIALPIVEGHGPYLAWVREETEDAAS
jgi:periplasmic divalent cation tolerance protein